MNGELAEEMVDLLREIKEEIKENNREVKFLTRQEVMKMLKYSELTVTKMFRRADFPAITLGKNYVVEQNALIEWCKERKD